MKLPDTEIALFGPTAEPQRWLIRHRSMKAGHHAETDWDRRILTFNTRRRNLRDKLLTVFHEAVHVTVGPHGHERLAENIEANVKQLIKLLELD